jgi:TPR repeat protein
MSHNLITNKMIGAAINRFTSSIFSRSVDRDGDNALPKKIREIRTNNKIRTEELDFMKRREERDNSLLKLSTIRLKNDITTSDANLKFRNLELQTKKEELEEKNKISRLYLDALREQTALEVELKEKEIQAIYDQKNWNGAFSREEIKQIFNAEKDKHHLLMLVAVPDMSEELPLSFRDSIRKEIRGELKEFLERYYPLNNDKSPVEFYGNYFEHAVYDAQIKQLEVIIPLPTAMIYSDITDHKVYFHARLTGLEEDLSFSCGAWNWEDVFLELCKEGMNEKRAFRQIRQIIVKIHQLLAAFLADWYYLNVNPYYEPQLFNLKDDLTLEFPLSWIEQSVNELQRIQTEYRTAYEQELQHLDDINHEYMKGQEYIQSKTYDKAFHHFRRAAEQGHPDAQYALGDLYAEKKYEGVKTDEEAAFYWFEQSAAQHKNIAINRVAHCYQEGIGILQDYEEAIFWYLKTAEQDDPDGQAAIGHLFEFGLGVECDEVQAMTWYRKAAKQDHAGAQFNLGWMYQSGKGLAQDYYEATHWYSRAAKQQHIEAQFALGQLFAQGLGVKQDYQEAFKWYLMSAKQGNPEAQLELGLFYLNGIGVVANPKIAGRYFYESAIQNYAAAQVELGKFYQRFGGNLEKTAFKIQQWFLRAAEQGNSEAQYHLGLLYENGLHRIESDMGQAAKWFRLAAEHNHPQAQLHYAVLLEEGNGVPPDFQQALYWFKQAASYGCAEAQYHLGELSEKGLHMDQNYEIAFAWYQQAANQEHAQAQCWLGMMYEYGRGTAQNYGAAFRWYQASAKQGFYRGQEYLAAMYERGCGIKEDVQEALIWYLKAAEQNSTVAQTQLGRLYEEGNAVRTNYQEAKKWYELAAQQGDADAQHALETLNEKLKKAADILKRNKSAS